MKVSFSDFAVQVSELRAEIDVAIARVLDRAYFILGPEVEAFERAFAAYLGIEHVIGVANGTDAIQLALMALGIGPGDEVICPALTAAPTALAILAAGARPVFADIDPVTYTLAPARLDECLSERTRAIVPVHLYGLPADMPAVLRFAEEHELPVIEDTAQAHGACVGGRKAGTPARLGCYSFYPTKNLGAYGDGGAISTGDPDLAGRIRQLRDLGQRGRFDHALPGLNSRLDELQAAILQVRLAHLDAQNAARRERAVWYADLLRGLPDLVLPTEPEGFTHVYHLYVVRHPRRDALREHLHQRGIGSDVHYPVPLHRQAAFAGCRVAKGGLPVAEKVTREIVSLPMYPQLPRHQIEMVAEAIRAWLGR